MEAAMATSDHYRHLLLRHPLPNPKLLSPYKRFSFPFPCGNLTSRLHCCAKSSPPPPSLPPVVEQRGGKMVVELVGAFNELTERMGETSTTSSSQLLFKSLKLSIPLLQSLPFAADGRPPLSRALSVAFLLADSQAKRLKAIMLASAEMTALRLRGLPSANHRGRLEIDHKNRVFRFLDKNGDGRISIKELTEVMEELGAGGKDA